MILANTLRNAENFHAYTTHHLTSTHADTLQYCTAHGRSRAVSTMYVIMQRRESVGLGVRVRVGIPTTY